MQRAVMFRPATRPLGGLLARSSVGMRSLTSSATVAKLFGSLRAPIIGAPLFIVSNPDLVIAQCKVCMGCAWAVRGLCVARAWRVHGACMECACCIRIVHMHKHMHMRTHMRTHMHMRMHKHMHMHVRTHVTCAHAVALLTVQGGHHRLLPGAQRAAQGVARRVAHQDQGRSRRAQRRTPRPAGGAVCGQPDRAQE